MNAKHHRATVSPDSCDCNFSLPPSAQGFDYSQGNYYEMLGQEEQQEHWEQEQEQEQE